MSALPTDPPREPKQELFETLLSKLIVTFLCALLGFVLIPVSYLVISFLDVDVTKFESSSSAYFILSGATWILVGLCTPFPIIKSLFEELKDMAMDHVVMFIAAVIVFLFIYWFVMTFIVSMLNSVLGAG